VGLDTLCQWRRDPPVEPAVTYVVLANMRRHDEAIAQVEHAAVMDPRFAKPAADLVRDIESRDARRAERSSGYPPAS
jgi:hypothetical protein